jgi:hypothetical protein
MMKLPYRRSSIAMNRRLPQVIDIGSPPIAIDTW